jgi:U3 small nucleolar RNA-associated protein 5
LRFISFFFQVDFDEDDEPSFEMQLKQAEQKAHPLQSAPATQRTLQQATSSLITMLVQALRTGDESLLSLCLSPKHPVESVQATLQELPSDLVFPLIHEIVKEFNNEKGYGAPHLIRWIKHVLVYHTGYLLTIPKVHQRLQVLHGALSQRLKAYTKFQNLKGRLDVLESQVGCRVALLLYVLTPC